MNMNKSWFTSKLEELGKTQTKVADELGIDKASLSKTINGQRKLQLEEAIALSKSLNCPVDEVLVNVGLIKNSVEQTSQLLGYFAQDGTVTRTDQGRVHNPNFNKCNVFVLQHRAESSLDGWLFFFEKEVTPVQLSTAGLITVTGGAEYIGVATRGYVLGEYRIKSIVEHQPIASTQVIGFNRMVGAIPQE